MRGKNLRRQQGRAGKARAVPTGAALLVFFFHDGVVPIALGRERGPASRHRQENRRALHGDGEVRSRSHSPLNMFCIPVR